VGTTQQSRLTALAHSSGELGLERELEQDAPLRFRWNLSASYGGILSPLRSEGQVESGVIAERADLNLGVPLLVPARIRFLFPTTLASFAWNSLANILFLRCGVLLDECLCISRST
jgi:hypothetical protein